VDYGEALKGGRRKIRLEAGINSGDRGLRYLKTVSLRYFRPFLLCSGFCYAAVKALEKCLGIKKVFGGREAPVFKYALYFLKYKNILIEKIVH